MAVVTQECLDADSESSLRQHNCYVGTNHHNIVLAGVLQVWSPEPIALYMHHVRNTYPIWIWPNQTMGQSEVNRIDSMVLAFQNTHAQHLQTLQRTLANCSGMWLMLFIHYIYSFHHLSCLSHVFCLTYMLLFTLYVFIYWIFNRVVGFFGCCQWTHGHTIFYRTESGIC